LSPGPLVNRSAAARPESAPEAPVSVEPVAVERVARLPRLVVSVAVLVVGLMLAWLRLRGR
jgi:hypothetical protein